ncbi:digestive organ expansion factor [Ochromonadaceae sp. CCMP2298]|nr:digestive organ expansion factor [Ochromonadaceae sp. CCMP2298]
MTASLGVNTSVSGMEKLLQDFSPPPQEDDARSDKPADWRALFDANVDDDFKLGIQLNPGHGRGTGANKGVHVRLFADFFQSDVILASPIGLRLAIGAPIKGKKERDGEDTEEKSKGKNDKDKDNKDSGVLSADFLSSLEVVLLHRADVLYMQNWEHVQHVLGLSNKLPNAMLPDTDFSRVRQYFLEGRAVQRRQLLLSSRFNEPELQSFFRTHARSIAGSVRLRRHWGEGCLGQVLCDVRQVSVY